jgi:hypothetical protein
VLTPQTGWLPAGDARDSGKVVPVAVPTVVGLTWLATRKVNDLVHACPVGARPQIEHAPGRGPIEVQRQRHYREGVRYV